MKKNDKPALLVSRCLLGDACRYAGDSCPNAAVRALEKNYRLVGICPETDGGLPTPRPPAEICEGRVLTEAGEDFTREFKAGAEIALQKARSEGAEIAVLKARSPSCGKNTVYDGTHTHTLTPGNGITADALLAAGIAVYTEEEIEAGLLPATE